MLMRRTMIIWYNRIGSWTPCIYIFRGRVYSRFASDLSQYTKALVDDLLNDDDSEANFKRRVALAKAITLAESSNEEHIRQADLLMQHISSRKYDQSDNELTSGNHCKKSLSFRIGITGSPG